MAEKHLLLSLLLPAHKVLRQVVQAGGTPYLVGGAARDFVMGQEPVDVDIEVFGLELHQLEAILLLYGPVKEIGKKFGVFICAPFAIDWSLPRTDCAGRKPLVFSNPFLTLEEAARRRDLTINALYIDLSLFAQKEAVEIFPHNLSSFLIIKDPYGGLKDIENKTLKAVDAGFFGQDPLRLVRAAGFIARFDMQPDASLTLLAQTMPLKDPVSGKEISKERVYEELKKILLLSSAPSRAFRWLLEVGRLKELFPELHKMVGVHQRSDYHPEGDVFEHSMQTVDAAACIKENYSKAPDKTTPPFFNCEQQFFVFMLAALYHDVGKSYVTTSDGRAHGHDVQGAIKIKEELKRYTDDASLIETVAIFIRFHLMPASFISQNSSAAAYRRLAHKCAPYISLYSLAHLALCDMRGRNGKSKKPLANSFSVVDEFVYRAYMYHVLHVPLIPLLKGADLIPHGYEGKEIGLLLKRAYELQMEKGIENKEELLKKIIS